MCYREAWKNLQPRQAREKVDKCATPCNQPGKKRGKTYSQDERGKTCNWLSARHRATGNKRGKTYSQDERGKTCNWLSARHRATGNKRGKTYSQDWRGKTCNWLSALYRATGNKRGKTCNWLYGITRDNGRCETVGKSRDKRGKSV